MNDVKLIYYSDIIKLLFRRWYIYILATIFAVAFCLYSNTLPFTPTETKKTSFLVEGYSESKYSIDYTKSVVEVLAGEKVPASVVKNINATLPNKDIPVNIDLVREVYGVYFNVLVSSKNTENIDYALDTIADYFKNTKSYDNATFHVLQHKESNGFSTKKMYNVKNTAVLLIFVYAVISIILLLIELCRTKIVYPDEARKVSSLDFVIDFNDKKLNAKQALETYLKSEKENKISLLPIQNNIHSKYIKDIETITDINILTPLEGDVSGLENLGAKVFLMIERGKCDFRTFTKYVSLCKECKAFLCGVIII